MFKKVTPLDRENVDYWVNTEDISLMSRVTINTSSLIIDPTAPKTHTLILLKNGQNLVVKETPEDILSTSISAGLH